MHAFIFYKVTHQVVCGHGKVVLLTIKAVDEIEEGLGFEVGQFQLVDIVSNQVIWITTLCRKAEIC